jgi:hypothetical protein
MKQLCQFCAAMVLGVACVLSASAGEIGNPVSSSPPAQTRGDMDPGVTSTGYMPNGVTAPDEMLQPLTAPGDISCGVTAITLALILGML